MPLFVRFAACGGLLSLLLTVSALAGAAPAGKDHRMISPYAGSTLYMHGDNAYTTVPMLVADSKGKPVIQNVEGKAATRFYLSAKGAGTLEVFRNYQAALAKSGFSVLYQCDHALCGKHGVFSKISEWGRNVIWSEPGNIMVNNATSKASEYYYLHARKPGPAGQVDVHLTVRSGEDYGQRDEIQQFLQVVEAKPVELGKVTVDAAAIGNALKRDGKIALYGILFDTNQAQIKPASDATLAEMAKALKANPGVKVFIVGHTDNVGDLVANVALSKKRADAVVAALAKRHGIGAERMQAQGVANFAPVGGNDSEDGRARNRRVEMVVR